MHLLSGRSGTAGALRGALRRAGGLPDPLEQSHCPASERLRSLQGRLVAAMPEVWTLSNLPPASVLAARLQHELQTARIYAEAERLDMALKSIEKAETVLLQLKEAMK